MRVLSERSESKDLPSRHSYSHGDVLVRSQVVGFKKIKFFTNENIGDGKLELPENEMHTTSYWITLERPLLESLPFTVSERQSGMFGLLHALESVATLLLMCDRRDLGTAIGERAFTLRPLKVAEGPSSDSSDPNNVILAQSYPNSVIPSEAQDLNSSLSITPPFETDFSSTRFENASCNAKEFFEPNLYLFDGTPLSNARSSRRKNPRTNFRLSLRTRMPILCGPRRRPRPTRKRSRPRHSRQVVRLRCRPLPTNSHGSLR